MLATIIFQKSYISPLLHFKNRNNTNRLTGPQTTWQFKLVAGEMAKTPGKHST